MSLILAFGLLFAVNAGAATGLRARSESLESVILKMEQAADRQEADLCSYSVDRRYTVQNKYLHPDMVMNVHLVYKRGEGKHFQPPSMPDGHGLVRRSLLNLLKEEEQLSREPDSNGQYNSANYDFALIGVERLAARICYHVKLKPRRRSKFLVDGEAWISEQDDALIQVKGQLSQKPSFWVRQPEFEQHFEEIQNFWFPSYNHSVTNVTLAGEVVLTIEYSNYQVKRCQEAPARAPQ